MKLEDAPPPGWYPDPEGGGSLRWWEGTDWGAARRVPASTAEVANALRAAAEVLPPDRFDRGIPEIPGSQRETRQMISQMREAAREEAEAAGQLLTRKVTAAIDQLQRTVADYVGPTLRWFKIALVTVAILVIVWFVIQFIAQVTLLEWFGDRIDNLTN